MSAFPRVLAIAFLLLAGLLTLLLLAYGSMGWADLTGPSLHADATAVARGRKLLWSTADRHGLAARSRYRTMEVVARDEWSGGAAWWPAAQQRFRAQRLLGTFTSRAELLDGPGAGEIWGIQSWKSYRIAKGGGPPRFAPDRAIQFYLPTLQYFDELPFRLARAGIVLDAGARELRGRRYSRVLATWGSLAPHAAHDQYELWINLESRRIEKVAYTLRDAELFAPLTLRPLARAKGVGTMHYEDYREVGGVWLPWKQTVTFGRAEEAPERLDEGFAHRIVVESVLFDTIDSEHLMPDASLPDPGDDKPSDVYGSGAK